MTLLCGVLLLLDGFTLPETLPGWKKADADPAHPAIRAVFKIDQAEIRVTVGPGKLEAWQERAAGMFDEVEGRSSAKGTLGGQESLVLDLRGKKAGHALRITSHLAARGGSTYELAVIRWDDALDDEEIDADAERMRAAFAFVVEPEKAPAPEAAPAPPRPPDPRREVRLDFWKLAAVKPEGLVEVPASAFDELERKGGVVLRFDGERDGSRLVVRVYAQSRRSERHVPIGKLVEARIAHFAKEEAEQRSEPVAGEEWDLPLAEETRTLRLARLRKGKEVVLWYFAECANGRQYQLQLFVGGGDGERTWAKEIAEVLGGLAPFR